MREQYTSLTENIKSSINAYNTIQCTHKFRSNKFENNYTRHNQFSLIIVVT